MPTSAELRRGLVAQLEQGGHITTSAVRRAFLAVRREIFLPAYLVSDGLEAVYKNDAIVTKKDVAGASVSSSSQPSIMAIMLEKLDLKPGHRVLEVGAGTGYNAALLKRIVGSGGRVTAIDIDPVTAREARSHLRRQGSPVRVVAGDGRRGWKDGAPYDRIIATASLPGVPRAWHRQLVRDGLIELPITLSDRSYLHQVVAVFEKDGRGLRSVAVVPGGFMSVRPAADAHGQIGPYAVVEMRGVGPAAPIAGVTGEAFIGLDDERKRRLVSLAIGELRERTVDVDLSGGFPVFAVLAGPRGRDIVGGTGLADRSARSIAFVRIHKGRSRIFSAGGAWAEERLQRLVERWHAIGAPNAEDLRIRITYGSDAPRAWRTVRRGRSYISFDWSTRTKRT